MSKPRPGETTCDGCAHGPACRVFPCVICGKPWHHLGLTPDPFICWTCEERADEIERGE